MATNGYTPKNLAPSVRRQVVPIGSYIVATAPLSRATAKRILPNNRANWTRKRFLNYFRLSDDNRLIFGGRPNLSPNLDLHEVANGMRAAIGVFFPQLSGVEITHVWGGTLGATFDLLPHVGRTNDGVWYAVGYGGHGVAMATQVGNDVGSLIGGATDTSPVARPSTPYPAVLQGHTVVPDTRCIGISRPRQDRKMKAHSALDLHNHTDNRGWLSGVENLHLGIVE